MKAYKIILRDILGLIVIVSTILAVLGILLDGLVLFAYVSHEQVIADLFFHESFYLLIFLIPPYFLVKYINKPELVAEIEQYLLIKHKSENP